MLVLLGVPRSPRDLWAEGDGIVSLEVDIAALRRSLIECEGVRVRAVGV